VLPFGDSRLHDIDDGGDRHYDHRVAAHHGVAGHHHDHLRHHYDIYSVDHDYHGTPGDLGG
jgi:hypothetical protein